MTQVLSHRYNADVTGSESEMRMNIAKQELEDFHQFAQGRLSNGGADLSLDELFDLWRSENPSDELYAENVAALRVALDDFANGDRGTLAGEHSAKLRREFGASDE